MCSAVNLVQTDVPTADDQNGLVSLYGNFPGNVTFQYLRPDGGTTNELYWYGNSSQPGPWSTLVDPRIACTNDPYQGPDCTVGSVTTDGYSKVQLKTLAGSNGYLSLINHTKTLYNYTIRPVDVAVKHFSVGQEIVAAYRDKYNYNSVRIIKWKLSDNSTTIWNTGIKSQVDPRVAYNEEEGSFYVLIVGRDRKMRLVRSNSTTTDWNTSLLSDSSGSSGGLGSTFMPAGIVCDAHSNAVGTMRKPLPSCRLVYSPYSQGAQYKSGTMRACYIRQNPFVYTWYLSGCVDTDFSGEQPVDIADYGNGVPAGWPTGPDWLLSYGLGDSLSSLAGNLVFNTNSFFQDPVVDMEVSKYPRMCTNGTMHGGWSLDYCEYLDRFIAVEKGACP